MTLSFSDFPCSQDQYNVLFYTKNYLMYGESPRSFKPAVKWDLTELALECTELASSERTKSAANSFFWLLSSTRFEQLISGLVDQNLSIAVSVLVHTTSMLHGLGYEEYLQQYSFSDVSRVRSFAGSQVLLGLEAALSNRNLARMSLDQLKAIFLVIFATTTIDNNSLPTPRSPYVRNFSMIENENIANVGQRLQRCLIEFLTGLQKPRNSF